MVNPKTIKICSAFCNPINCTKDSYGITDKLSISEIEKRLLYEDKNIDTYITSLGYGNKYLRVTKKNDKKLISLKTEGKKVINNKISTFQEELNHLNSHFNDFHNNKSPSDDSFDSNSNYCCNGIENFIKLPECKALFEVNSEGEIILNKNIIKGVPTTPKNINNNDKLIEQIQIDLFHYLLTKPEKYNEITEEELTQLINKDKYNVTDKTIVSKVLNLQLKYFNKNKNRYTVNMDIYENYINHSNKNKTANSNKEKTKKGKYSFGKSFISQCIWLHPFYEKCLIIIIDYLKMLQLMNCVDIPVDVVYLWLIEHYSWNHFEKSEVIKLFSRCKGIKNFLEFKINSKYFKMVSVNNKICVTLKKNDYDNDKNLKLLYERYLLENNFTSDSTNCKGENEGNPINLRYSYLSLKNIPEISEEHKLNIFTLFFLACMKDFSWIFCNVDNLLIQINKHNIPLKENTIDYLLKLIRHNKYYTTKNYSITTVIENSKITYKTVMFFFKKKDSAHHDIIDLGKVTDVISKSNDNQNKQSSTSNTSKKNNDKQNGTNTSKKNSEKQSKKDNNKQDNIVQSEESNSSISLNKSSNKQDNIVKSKESNSSISINKSSSNKQDNIIKSKKSDSSISVNKSSNKQDNIVKSKKSNSSISLNKSNNKQDNTIKSKNNSNKQNNKKVLRNNKEDHSELLDDDGNIFKNIMNNLKYIEKDTIPLILILNYIFAYGEYIEYNEYSDMDTLQKFNKFVYFTDIDDYISKFQMINDLRLFIEKHNKHLMLIPGSKNTNGEDIVTFTEDKCFRHEMPVNITSNDIVLDIINSKLIFAFRDEIEIRKDSTGINYIGNYIIFYPYMDKFKNIIMEYGINDDHQDLDDPLIRHLEANVSSPEELYLLRYYIECCNGITNILHSIHINILKTKKQTISPPPINNKDISKIKKKAKSPTKNKESIISKPIHDNEYAFTVIMNNLKYIKKDTIPLILLLNYIYAFGKYSEYSDDDSSTEHNFNKYVYLNDAEDYLSKFHMIDHLRPFIENHNENVIIIPSSKNKYGEDIVTFTEDKIISNEIPIDIISNDLILSIINKKLTLAFKNELKITKDFSSSINYLGKYIKFYPYMDKFKNIIIEYMVNNDNQDLYNKLVKYLEANVSSPEELYLLRYYIECCNGIKNILYNLDILKTNKQDKSPRKIKSYCVEKEEESIIRKPIREKYNHEIMKEVKKLLPSEKDFQILKILHNKVSNIIINRWPKNDLTLHLFGSSINGLWTHGSDVDLCIFADTDNDYSKMRILANVLRSNNMQRVIPIENTRIPICKFRDPTTGLNCDITVNNRVATFNSELIRCYTELDKRVRDIILIIKKWSKCRGINDSKNHYFSSYSFVLLCLSFFQNIEPPVIPNLQKVNGFPALSMTKKTVEVPRKILKNQGSGSFPVTIQYYNEYKKISKYFKTQNTMNHSELLIKFFDYYSHHYDYNNTVCSIRSDRGILKKNSFKTRFAIEDPFIHERNTTSNSREKEKNRIIKEFARAYNILKLPNSKLNDIFKK